MSFEIVSTYSSAAGGGGTTAAALDTVVLRGDGGGDYLQALRSAANESDGCACSPHEQSARVHGLQRLVRPLPIELMRPDRELLSCNAGHPASLVVCCQARADRHGHARRVDLCH